MKTSERTITYMHCNLHPKRGEEFRLEWVKAHDSVEEDYYRVCFGESVTVFLSKEQLDYLTMVLKG